MSENSFRAFPESRCTPLNACAAQSHSQSQPHSQSLGVLAAFAGLVQVPTTQPALPTVPTQVSVDTLLSPSRTTAPPAQVAVVVNSTPAPVPARHPLSLMHAEYEALTSQSQSPLPQSSPNEPASASAVPLALKPANEILVPLPLKETRPNTPFLPSHSASRVDASAASSSMAVMAAHFSTNPHKSCSRKHRAERANSPVKSAAKQEVQSAPVLAHTAIRAFTKSAAAVAATASSALPILSSSSTHANLQQFALPHLSDLSLSLRSSQIVAMSANSEFLSATHPERASTLRVKTLRLQAVASRVEDVILVEEDLPPPFPPPLPPPQLAPQNVSRDECL